MAPSAAPLQWRTDLVTVQVLVKALKDANPDLLVLDIDDEEGSRSTLTTVDSLGVGSYGYVEKCRLQLAGDNFGQMVAVKRFHHNHRPNIQQLNHFLKESSVLGSLQHKHIVRLVGIGTVDGTIQGLYTAQELVDGQNLMQLVESQVLSQGKALYTTPDAIRWCLQLAEAMRYIHIEHDLVHRDIKLSNVVLTSSNVSEADVKLLDWGLASKAPEPELQPPRVPSDTTGWGHSLRGHLNRTPAHRASSTDRVGQLAKDIRLGPRSSLSTGSLGQPRASTSGRQKGGRRAEAPSRNSRDSCPGNSAKGANASRLATSSPVLPASAMPSKPRPAARWPSRADMKMRSASGGIPTLGGTGCDIDDLMATGSTGTPIYMAPETRLSNMFDQAVDVYCFGMLAYELFNCTTVLREAAMAGHTSATGAAAMMSGGWEPKFREWCPREIKGLVARCWDPDPCRRPTADEIVVTLAEMQERLAAKTYRPEDTLDGGKLRSRRSTRSSDASTPSDGAKEPVVPTKPGRLSQLFSCFSRGSKAL